MDKLVLPKPYLSYSQINLWLSNKELYRDVYYRNNKFPVNAAMIFGGEVGKLLEDNHPSVRFIPRYSNSEESLTVDLGPVSIHGKIDSFDPQTNSIIEYKTHAPKWGWTENKVAKHKQLDIYSLMVFEKLGIVNEEVTLYGLETRVRTEISATEDVNGIVWKKQLEPKYELTGVVTKFTRIITQHERDDVRALIIATAQEIAEDFALFSTQSQREVVAP